MDIEYTSNFVMDSGGGGNPTACQDENEEQGKVSIQLLITVCLKHVFCEDNNLQHNCEKLMECTEVPMDKYLFINVL